MLTTAQQFVGPRKRLREITPAKENSWKMPKIKSSYNPKVYKTENKVPVLPSLKTSNRSILKRIKSKKVLYNLYVSKIDFDDVENS